MRKEYSEATVEDIVAWFGAQQSEEDEVERVRDLECYARELVIALRRQSLLSPHHLGVAGCAAAAGLERMVGEGWVMSAAAGDACRLAEETFAGLETADLPGGES